MSTFNRKFLFAFFLVLCLVVAFLSGYALSLHFSEQSFPLLEEAHALLLKYALEEPPPPTELEYGMIKGMIEKLNDPFTIFAEPVQTELTADSLQGRYGGIGAEFGRDADGYWVLYPCPNNPAADAGIQEADRLVAVDKVTILPETALDTIKAAIRGPVGEPVLIEIVRLPDFAHYEFSLEREEIPLPSLIWYKAISEPRVGVIKVNLIAASTPDEILQAVADLKSRDATHFILDLRDNGGGLLEAGVNTARLFLTQGDVMQQQYRHRGIETFQVIQPGPLNDLPLVVLVNRGTGSAAEIIAGALKAHKRAPLVGEPTFGKTSLQLIFELRDGSSMHVTSGKWWIPNLDSPLEGLGLQPDYLLPIDTLNTEVIIEDAINIMLGSG